MSIIIMNLLVGLAVDDITSVMRVATVKRLEMRVRLTLDVEQQLLRRLFYGNIRRFRNVIYYSSRWRNFLAKIFNIQIKTEFQKNIKRLENSGIVSISGSQDQKTSTDATKTDDKSKTTLTTTGSGGISPDWITTVHTQINTKYIEFNRHMTDLKAQQEKINNILQQFPASAPSRHSSHLTFQPTTTA